MVNPYTINIIFGRLTSPISPVRDQNVVVSGEVTTFDEPRDLAIRSLCFIGEKGCPDPFIGSFRDDGQGFHPDVSVITPAMDGSLSAGRRDYFFGIIRRMGRLYIPIWLSKCCQYGSIRCRREKCLVTFSWEWCKTYSARHTVQHKPLNYSARHTVQHKLLTYSARHTVQHKLLTCTLRHTVQHKLLTYSARHTVQDKLLTYSARHTVQHKLLTYTPRHTVQHKLLSYSTRHTVKHKLLTYSTRHAVQHQLLTYSARHTIQRKLLRVLVPRALIWGQRLVCHLAFYPLHGWPYTQPSLPAHNQSSHSTEPGADARLSATICGNMAAADGGAWPCLT